MIQWLTEWHGRLFSGCQSDVEEGSVVEREKKNSEWVNRRY